MCLNCYCSSWKIIPFRLINPLFLFESHVSGLHGGIPVWHLAGSKAASGTQRRTRVVPSSGTRSRLEEAPMLSCKRKANHWPGKEQEVTPTSLIGMLVLQRRQTGEREREEGGGGLIWVQRCPYKQGTGASQESHGGQWVDLVGDRWWFCIVWFNLAAGTFAGLTIAGGASQAASDSRAGSHRRHRWRGQARWPWEIFTVLLASGKGGRFSI